MAGAAGWKTAFSRPPTWQPGLAVGAAGGGLGAIRPACGLSPHFISLRRKWSSGRACGLKAQADGGRGHRLPSARYLSHAWRSSEIQVADGCVGLSVICASTPTKWP